MIAAFVKGRLEEFKTRIEALTPDKDKGFGQLMAAAFALIALFAWRGESEQLYVFASAAVMFLFLAYTLPVTLRFLHVPWLGLGLFLETFLAPLIMLGIYAVGFVPFALLFRLAGRDVLHLKKDTTKTSYWCKRDFSPTADDFKQQF